MSSKIKSSAVLITALLVFCAASTVMFFMTTMPRIEDAKQQKETKSLDLLEKHADNPDMIGWLQVEGTAINYPVMNSEHYLYRDFNDTYDESGSLFTEEGWGQDSICSLIYGHNMWMYGTMFNPLHRFEKKDFFDRNRVIRFYVITEEGRSAEKRTYRITHLIKTDVSEWNFASCQFITDQEGLSGFLDDCDGRASFRKTAEMAPDEIIVLSTCSYHIEGRNGRLLLVGSLEDTVNQTTIDSNDYD